MKLPKVFYAADNLKAEARGCKAPGIARTEARSFGAMSRAARAYFLAERALDGIKAGKRVIYVNTLAEFKAYEHTDYRNGLIIQPCLYHSGNMLQGTDITDFHIFTLLDAGSITIQQHLAELAEEAARAEAPSAERRKELFMQALAYNSAKAVLEAAKELADK